MKYLFTIYTDESRFADATPQDVEDMLTAYVRFGHAASEAGVLLGGEGLQASGTATTVRVRDGETITSDGPFAETREQLGGYYLLDCRDEDDALGWAARIPGAAIGTVEMRPVMDYEAAGVERAPRAEEGVR